MKDQLAQKLEEFYKVIIEKMVGEDDNATFYEGKQVDARVLVVVCKEGETFEIWTPAKVWRKICGSPSFQ